MEVSPFLCLSPRRDKKNLELFSRSNLYWIFYTFLLMLRTLLGISRSFVDFFTKEFPNTKFQANF